MRKHDKRLGLSSRSKERRSLVVSTQTILHASHASPASAQINQGLHRSQASMPAMLLCKIRSTSRGRGDALGMEKQITSTHRSAIAPDPTASSNKHSVWDKGDADSVSLELI